MTRYPLGVGFEIQEVERSNKSRVAQGVYMVLLGLILGGILAICINHMMQIDAIVGV